ncbi:hypothetical protein BCE_1537 [Bacillus cereus ATCC 10987]|uniref:Uncharacterized protein n=1 Tax=Bacillus cereus (strain ATCC 10987 / NRS 248) TaxID=222523 RepID=Q73B83_BACC1|nr:hypothetical protein BCE_1537 [Bacillus cereus ATCC 10987]
MNNTRSNFIKVASFFTYFSNHSAMKSFTNWEFLSYEEEIYGMIK